MLPVALVTSFRSQVGLQVGQVCHYRDLGRNHLVVVLG